MAGGKIVRIVGGESVKIAKKSISFIATEGNLTFSSPTRVIMNGKQGGVQYLNNYAPPLPLRIVKLDGPFDEKGQKVTVLEKEKWYAYKVIQFNRTPKNYEIKRIKWATQYDKGEINTKYPSVIGEKEVHFKIPEKVNVTRLRVFAFLEKPIDEVSVETGLKAVKFPILIIQSVARKGKKIIEVNGVKRSSNETAIDLLYKDYPENEVGFAKLRNQLRQETYNVHKEDGIFTSREDYANTKADKIIEKVKEFSKKTNAELFEIFKFYATNLSRLKLKENTDRMILKMQNNEGGEYSDVELTNAVIEHENTIKFIDNVKKWVISYLKLEKFKNNPEGLRIIDDSEGIIYNSSFKSKVDKPRFNNTLDKLSGIQIAINDVWAYKIFLSKYYINNNEPYGELRFDFYDHFGLDYPDIEKYNNDIFIAWFVLQHFRGYKPFITHISFTSKF